MAVVAKTATQNHVKLIKSNQDYVTGMETCKFAYKWIINNVECDQKKIKSPKFSSHYSDFNDEWILEMDPDAVLYSDGHWICEKFVSIQLQSTKFNSFNDTSQFQTECEIIVDDDINLEKLLLNKKLADVTIQVGQKSFRAIKSILAVRSPVFAAIFDHEQFKGNEKNEVVIEDIDEDVFKEFLHYIYTGETPNIDKMPIELFAVAEKYQVDCLKNICKEIIAYFLLIHMDNLPSDHNADLKNLKEHKEFINVVGLID
ncbi:speckle-type POZ protein-like [Aphidius gifuensis]|uniref:speckle-type POZ protein-like n=1 Tax=Aphidius gifuensis TaxID=684658 RepID=UPI001CDB7258|nr:speckle-type POZ protein-like [Aphidius gifuensis]